MLDGRVLVVGGNSRSVEIYDPAADSWSDAAPMDAIRNYCTATLLHNGKVLVVGGGYVSFLSSSILYDPLTNAWSTPSPSSHWQYRHTATKLLDGRVLVTIGNIAEIYEPSSDSWRRTGNLNFDRQWDSVAGRLDDGTVLVAGGGYGGILYSNTAEIFNPATETWCVTGSLRTGRFDAVGGKLGDGTFLITGGHSGIISWCSGKFCDDFTLTTQIYLPSVCR